MGWIKEKYKEILAGWILTLISLLIAFSLNGARDNNKELERKVDKKADKTYVDDQNKLQDQNISKKADLSLVESMDSKLDLILKKL